MTIAVSAAAAQQPAPALPDVRPGDAAIDARRVHTGSWEVRYFRVADGTETEIGTMTQELDEVAHRAVRALRSVQRFTTGQGSGADTSIHALPTLAPLYHGSAHPGRTLSLAFGDGVVTGRMTRAGDPAQDVRHALAAPVFDSNALEIVLGALPLAPGYAARFAMYSFEKAGEIRYEIAVRGAGTAQVGGHTAPVWNVELTGEQGRGSFSIHRDTGQFVAGSFFGPDGSELRFRRVSQTPPTQAAGR
jgi:hypothetical protein